MFLAGKKVENFVFKINSTLNSATNNLFSATRIVYFSVQYFLLTEYKQLHFFEF